MRNAFAKEITHLAQEDDRIVLLSGDIGNRLFDEFKDRCPDRFYNCGVAEANMIGVAAGLALCGFRPVCYTIAPFITYRCMEQIRVDLCYHHLPVTIVGTGAGLAYASLGGTHHSCEDVGMLRTLPGMNVLTPADDLEVRASLRAALTDRNPSYLRIGKKGEPRVHTQPLDWRLGSALPLRAGQEIALLVSGVVLPLALSVADELSAQGHSTAVYSFPAVKPLDVDTLRTVFSQCQLVAAIEEHSTIAGFTSAIAEWLSDQTTPCAPLLRFGTPDAFFHQTGEQEDARHLSGLTTGAILQRILDRLPCRR